MAVILIGAGILSFIYGILTLVGRTKNWAEDSEVDEKLFSQRSRYFLSRYYGGFRFLIAGVGAMVLGLILFMSHQ
jgi:hypothetical protein